MKIKLYLILILLAVPSVAGRLSAQVPALENGERRVELNGVAHWYKVAGAERGTVPLVIVHGGPGGNVYNFERVVGPLLEKFSTVVYYEQRGSGRSAAPSDAEAYSIPLLVSDLEALRAKLGWERVVLLGFSFGGELALEYELAHPDRIEKLILQSPSTGDWDRQRLVQIRGFLSIGRGETARRLDEIARGGGSIEEKWNEVWNAVDTATVDRLLFHDQTAARLNRRLWDESGLRNTGAMYRALVKKTPAAAPLPARARELTAETLFLVGLYDRNVGVDAVRDLAAAMPRAKLTLFERSAHFPDIEEPVEYARAVKNFILRKNETGPRKKRPR